MGTKTIATLGPATSSEEAIERLVHAGVNVVRLNFSHGDREGHRKNLDIVRAVSQRLKVPIAVMGDLCGPKIRLLEIEGGAADLTQGQRFHIVRTPVLGTAERVATNSPDMIDDVKVGHRVLIDDGAIRLRVVDTDTDGLVCECEVAGTIRDHKGLNLPDSDLRDASLTAKDRDDVAWAVEHGIEYIALSFVRWASDVQMLRELLESLNAEAHIISKIETRHAVRDLDPIIEASDGVIVARGDLGVEMDVATVPRIQKDITMRCHGAGKPVIVATQMLQSMVESPTPTRAEVSDVANAIIDGADALLLSAETAVGRYPAGAIQMLKHIAAETEKVDQNWRGVVEIMPGSSEVGPAVARSVCAVADEIDAKAVAVWTKTGRLARFVSKLRLDRPVVALTASPAAQRKMALYYGVIPVLATERENPHDRIIDVDRALIEAECAQAGDMVVLGFGPGSLASALTGSVIIHKLETVSQPTT
jgi:pyruvate kinase